MKKDNTNYSIEGRKIFLYGKPKTGKSTFASNMKGAYFISTEAGLDFLKVRNCIVKTWPGFLAFLDKVERKPELFEATKCFVVDTVDRLYNLCYWHVMDSLGIKEPRQNNYGKDWRALKAEWEGSITRLTLNEKGVLLIGHAKEIEVPIEDTSVEGATTTGFVSGMPVAAREFIRGLVDFTWCADQITVKTKTDGKVSRETTPYIFTQPSERYPDCGFRLLLPARIPFNYTAITREYDRAIKSKLDERSAK